MSSRCKKLALLSLLMVIILVAIPASVNAENKIESASVISDDPEEEVFPSVAYNSVQEEYLVVWYNDRPGNDDIRAQRLTRDGQKIGSPFYISAGAGDDRRYPDVAYNSQHDQYLVVWENEETDGYISIRARRVSGTGALIDSMDIILRRSNQYILAKPAVEYAYTSDRYMVVWAETHPALTATYFIYAQDLDHNGAGVTPLTEVAKDTTYLQEPDIAYNRHANRYLVVWQHLHSGTQKFDIKGRQVLGSGGIYDVEIEIAHYALHCKNPAVASIPTSSGNNKFLVAYEMHYGNTVNIGGNLITEEGTVGTLLGFANSLSSDETLPAVAGNEETQIYFVVWRDDISAADKPVKGVQYSTSGSSLGTTYELPGPATDNPAIAAGYQSDFLIVWQDQPVSATDMNIYAQLFGDGDSLPMFLPLFLNKP